MLTTSLKFKGKKKKGTIYAVTLLNFTDPRKKRKSTGTRVWGRSVAIISNSSDKLELS
jgi:hypothetical protein